MRKQYALSLLSALLFFSSCSKDFLKSYDNRILGTWKIIDIDRFGFNGADALPFDEGAVLMFAKDGALTFTQDNKTYTGSWDIQRMRNGEADKKALVLTAIDFTNQQVRSEYFNDMAFTNTNRFTAFIEYNTRIYVYRFLRQ